MLHKIERKFRNWGRIWANFSKLGVGGTDESNVQSNLKEGEQWEKWDHLHTATLLKEHNSINMKIPNKIKYSRVLSLAHFYDHKNS